MSIILNDHDDFSIYGDHLKDKRIAIIVTGGIAAYTVPSVIRALRRYNCEVFPYVTEEGLKFVTEDTLAWASKNKPVTKLTDKSEHLGQDNQSFDCVVVYPATYNFIGKMAQGIADDACSSLIASHLSIAKIIVCPTMHGHMYDSSILKHNLSILRLAGVKFIEPLMANNKANINDTVTTVTSIVRLNSDSNLYGKSVIVTAGPTPVEIDNVRRITNKFSGKLGIEIANELYLRGANVMLLQSYSGIRPPKYISSIHHKTYDEYKNNCLSLVNGFEYGIFSAAVADYKPKEKVEGKIPSKGAINSIELINTEKVIDLVMEKAPDMKLISFKYEEGKTLRDLENISRDRLSKGHHRVVANDISLNENGKQRCYLFGPKENSDFILMNVAEGKISIARMIADDMEKDVYVSIK